MLYLAMNRVHPLLNVWATVAPVQAILSNQGEETFDRHYDWFVVVEPADALTATTYAFEALRELARVKEAKSPIPPVSAAEHERLLRGLVESYAPSNTCPAVPDRDAGHILHAGHTCENMIGIPNLLQLLDPVAKKQAEADKSTRAAGSTADTVKMPTKAAFQAWHVRSILGITNQTEIAGEMTRRGTPATQGQVSKWLREVEAYRKSGGVMPNPEILGKPDSVDPDVLDMGPRQDGRTPRQREQPDSDD